MKRENLERASKLFNLLNNIKEIKTSINEIKEDKCMNWHLGNKVADIIKFLIEDKQFHEVENILNILEDKSNKEIEKL